MQLVLREGGRGNAVSIFPNLLPLLSCLPLDQIENKATFYENFFNNLLAGLAKVQSPSEASAILQAFSECLKFFLLSNTRTSDSTEDAAFLRNIFVPLSVLISNSLTTDRSTLIANALYPVLGDLLKSLNKVPELYEIFATELCGLIERTVHEMKDAGFTLNRTSNLIRALITNEVCKQKKKVGFATATTTQAIDSKSISISDKNLVALVFELAKFALSQEINEQWIVFILDLLSLDGDDIILGSLGLKGDQASDFFDIHLSKWFNLFDCSESANTSLTSLFFVLSVKSQNRPDFLDKIEQIQNIKALDSMFGYIAENYRTDKQVAKWMLSDSYSRIVLRLTEKLLKEMKHRNPSCESLWSIIRTCFSTELSNQGCLEKVLALFTNSLKSLKEEQANSSLAIDFTCDLIANLFDFYKPWSSLPAATALIVVLFTLSCQPSEKQVTLQNAWQKGLTQYLVNEDEFSSDDGLVASLSATANSLLFGELCDIPSAQLLTSNVLLFLDSVEAAAKEVNVSTAIFEALSVSLLLSQDQWYKLIAQVDIPYFAKHWIEGTSLPPALANLAQMRSIEVPPKLMFNASASSRITLRIVSIFKDSETKFTENQQSSILITQQVFLFACLGYLQQLAYRNTSTVLKQLDQDISTSLKRITEINFSGTSTLNEEILTQAYSNPMFALGLQKHNEFSQKDVSLDIELSTLTRYQLQILELVPSSLSSKRRHTLMREALDHFLCLDSSSLENAVGFLGILQACLKSTEKSTLYEPVLQPLLDTFDGMKDSKEDILNYTTKVSAVNLSKIRIASVAIEIFDLAIEHFFDEILRSHKFIDFILCSLTSWSLNVCIQKDNLLEDLHLLIFAARLFRLIKAVSQKLTADTLLDGISREWEGFHAKKIATALIDVLVTCYAKRRIYTGSEKALLSNLGEAIESLNVQSTNSVPHLFETAPQTDWTFPESASGAKKEILLLPENEDSLLRVLTPLLLDENRFYSVTGHKLLLKLMPVFAKSIKPPELSTERDETFLTPPLALLSILEETDVMVNLELSRYIVGDTYCHVDPSSDFCRITMAYLYNWLQLITLFANLDKELRPCFSEFLREEGFLLRLFNNLFRLMPVSSETADDGVLTVSEMFRTEAALSLDDLPTSSELQHLACRVYYEAVRKMPASARQWWSNQEKRITDIVNEFTAKFVSELLSTQELKSVQDADPTKFINMNIKARQTAREVFASYTFEEMSIELTIKMASNHPLGHLTIDGGKRIGVNSAQWRSWLLQLTTFLTHQNGSILDGLLLWKQNIDNRFEGVDECMICFYILHGSTCQLPKLTCRSCKKRFHTACLVSL